MLDTSDLAKALQLRFALIVHRCYTPSGEPSDITDLRACGHAGNKVLGVWHAAGSDVVHRQVPCNTVIMITAHLLCLGV